MTSPNGLRNIRVSAYPSAAGDRRIADCCIRFINRSVRRVAAAKPVDEDPQAAEAAQNEQRYRDAFTKAMNAGRIDAVVFPSSAQLPPINGDRNTQLLPRAEARLRRRTYCIEWWSARLSVSGAPSMARVVGAKRLSRREPAARPADLGREWAEDQIIGYAFAYEQATRHRRPPTTVPPLK